MSEKESGLFPPGFFENCSAYQTARDKLVESMKASGELGSHVHKTMLPKEMVERLMQEYGLSSILAGWPVPEQKKEKDGEDI